MHNTLLDLIQYEGDNENLVHHSQIEDFNSKSQLVVQESQEAIFFRDGQALDLFGPGRHTLTTQNLPLLRKVVGALFGGKTPYTCDVFFINKVCVMDIMWGTDSPISLEDPKYGLLIGVRSNGTLALNVQDSRRFVVNVVGRLKDYSVDNVKKAIKGSIMTVIKNAIANAIAVENVSILEISAKLMDLSGKCLELINNELEFFGLSLKKFYINNISCTEEDLAELKEAKAKAASMVIEAGAKAKSREIQGYDYRTERQFDVMDKAASNTGGMAGAFVGAGVGLGAGVGIGSAIGQTTKEALSENKIAGGKVKCQNCGSEIDASCKFCPNCGQENKPQARFCPNCGQKLEAGAKFCPNCGQKVGE